MRHMSQYRNRKKCIYIKTEKQSNGNIWTSIKTQKQTKMQKGNYQPNKNVYVKLKLNIIRYVL